MKKIYHVKVVLEMFFAPYWFLVLVRRRSRRVISGSAVML